ncbi:MAG: PAS domain-containing sensor histidine kinase [Candidatus Pacebacteria bacterium]|nr:PAS domain-containing sensor histidine kinase [Candidatus Paceibacterota bacterium]
MKKNKQEFLINQERVKERMWPKQEILEAMFLSAGDHIMAMVVVDKNGRIIRVNKGFETLTGWREKEAKNKFLVRVIPREDENKNRVPFKERILSRVLSGTILTNTATAAGGGIEKLPTFYYVRKNKTRFPATSVISPVLFNKKITGAVEVFYDITKEKELERIRMDFLSLASHQLRTPLSGTKWLIETMQSGILKKSEKKQKEYLHDIYEINEQMINLVFDILNTLRLESEEAIIKKERISAQKLFNDVLILVRAAAKEKKIILQSPLNHRALYIHTDPEILKSILGSFLSNAIDYSTVGQKVILDVQEKLKEIVFSVRDFGIGIPKKEQKRMFERFYRASNAKNFKPNGTGLGLNIAKILAEKIEGEILFESQENKGSVFYLILKKRSGKNKKI